MGVQIIGFVDDFQFFLQCVHKVNFHKQAKR